MSDAGLLEWIEGPAFVLGDDVNTDIHCSGKYLPGKDEAFIAAQAFDALSPGFARRFTAGGIIVAGRHFGINSSREQAAHILRRMQVAAVIAPSFGRQFFRNAINNGLPLLECDSTGLVEGDTVRIDLTGQQVQVAARQIARPCAPLPVEIRAILGAGGLIPFLRLHPHWELS